MDFNRFEGFALEHRSTATLKHCLLGRMEILNNDGYLGEAYEYEFYYKKGENTFDNRWKRYKNIMEWICELYNQ